jgi:ribosome-associated heat shock protein Hsp15
MSDRKPVRIDKFLWAVRLFKTRSMAADACRMGRILISNIQVKPSRTIEANEALTVRKPPAVFVFRIIEPLENRVAAKSVNNYLEDLTPESEKIKLEIRKSGPAGFRKKGLGRPTKKERRVIEKWKDGNDDLQAGGIKT